MKTQSSSWTRIALGVVVLLFGGFIYILWRLGLFDFSGTDASAKVVAASLALVGALFTAVVSIFGILLKHSIDQRNLSLAEQAERRLKIDSDRNARLAEEAERRLKIEADRNAKLAEEAEERLKLEASIRAVDLLGTDDGGPAERLQRDGALFALTSLRQYELAIELTDQLLFVEQLDPRIAKPLIDKGLIYGEPRVKEAVITVLHSHIRQMATENGRSAVPESILEWNLEMGSHARITAILCLAELLLVRPFADWYPGSINTILVAFVQAWKTEPLALVRNGAAQFLKSILSERPEYQAYTLYRGETVINLNEVWQEVSGQTSVTTTQMADMAERLKVWAKDEVDSGANDSHQED